MRSREEVREEWGHRDGEVMIVIMASLRVYSTIPSSHRPHILSQERPFYRDFKGLRFFLFFPRLPMPILSIVHRRICTLVQAVKASSLLPGTSLLFEKSERHPSESEEKILWAPSGVSLLKSKVVKDRFYHLVTKRWSAQKSQHGIDWTTENVVTKLGRCIHCPSELRLCGLCQTHSLTQPCTA